MKIKDKLLKRKKIIQVKIETEAGAAETEGFTDCLVYDPCMIPKAPGPAGPEDISKCGVFMCSAKLGGHVLTIKDPGVAIMCRACGFKKVSGAYTAPGGDKAITIRVFRNGVIKILAGAMGNVTFEEKKGKLKTAHFEFSGILSTEEISKAEISDIEAKRKEELNNP
jgi:hypothetical protein